MNVLIIGAGVMGKGIAAHLCGSSSVEKVYWKAGASEQGDLALHELHQTWNKMVRQEKASQADIGLWSEKAILVDSFSEIQAIDICIEAVSEDMEIKASVLTELSHSNLNDCVVATNTSSISITNLAQYCNVPQRFIGIHFFNPVHVMPLVEISLGLHTAKETISRATQFVKDIGKDYVIVNDSPGFVVNRMLIPMINEAVTILAEGVASAQDIDKAMRLGANHPIGPLKLADLIGNDVNLAIMETLYSETGDPKYRPHPLLKKMVRANRLGRKTGVGFFDYARTV